MCRKDERENIQMTACGVQQDSAEDTRKGNLHPANDYERKIIIAESNKSFDCNRMKQKVDGRSEGRSGKKCHAHLFAHTGIYNQLRRERIKSGNLDNQQR